jgi:hypothetical protein
MNREQEWALEDYLDEHPNGCEVSFNAGWVAAMMHKKKAKISAAMTGRFREKSPSWSNEITQKYNEAKELVIRGHTKAEACLQVGLSYDSYMRRQRIEYSGRDRIKK